MGHVHTRLLSFPRQEGRQEGSPGPAPLAASAASQASSGKRRSLCAAAGTETFSMATQPAAGRTWPAGMLFQRGTGHPGQHQQRGLQGAPAEPPGIGRKGRGEPVARAAGRVPRGMLSSAGHLGVGSVKGWEEHPRSAWISQISRDISGLHGQELPHLQTD